MIIDARATAVSAVQNHRQGARPGRPWHTGHTGACAPTRRAFTLIEVLLATALTATLLACLWSLVAIFNRLFETAPAKTEHARLVSAVVQQIADDLKSAIEDSPETDARFGPARGPSAARRFGLSGTSSSLRLDVLQALPEEKTPPGDGSPVEGLRNAPVLRVPELRTVFYEFVAAEDTTEAPASLETEPGDATQAETESTTESRHGLMRWEIDFETPLEKSRESRLARPLSKKTTEPAGAPTAAVDKPAEQDFSTFQPDDDSVTWIPEITRLEFRYFDGHGWSGSWDSLARKSLPVAVEITLEVRPSEDYLPGRPEPSQAAESEQPQKSPAARTPAAETQNADAEAEPLHPEPAAPPSPAYRFVIYLPEARLGPALVRPTLRSEPATGFPADSTVFQPPAYQPPTLQPPEPPRPSVFGRARTGRGSVAPLKPDQWMRNRP